MQKLQTESELLSTPNYPVILYLKQKSGLPQNQIRERLLKGLTFEIRGQGNELDSRLIEDVLIQNDFYQKTTQKQLKDQALRFVKNVVQQWSLTIAKEEKKINRDQLPNYTAKILAYGSYVLDLKSNSSDIDLVCVVPNFLNRQTHFFEGLAGKLELDPQVKGLLKVRSKKAPIITFDYKEINIDISFCKLEEETVPRDIERVLNMDKIQKIKDQLSKNAIMGRKNNLMILELVGINQLENFKQTLRLIKVWAKNRGISSNVMGYLGGISWSIMLAKICQIFPNHKPSKLLSEFFNIYKLWRFKEMPIILIEPTKENLEIATANQKSTTMMSVYTPGDHYNSTQKVNRITFDVIEREISRGCEILMYNRADFQTLCQKADFISSYPIFIELDICGTNKTREQQKDYKHFLGSVQSKILGFLSSIIKFNIKDLDNKTLKIVPNPKYYKKNDPNYELCNIFLLGVQVNGEVDLNKAVSQWCFNLDKERAGKEEHLNVRVFECFKEDILADVEVQEIQKKVEKEDPRLAMRARKG